MKLYRYNLLILPTIPINSYNSATFCPNEISCYYSYSLSFTITMDDQETNDECNENEIKIEYETRPTVIQETNDFFLKPTLIKSVKKKQCQNDSAKESDNGSLCAEEANPLCKEENSKQKVEKSPSQKIAEKEIPIPYKEPSWSGLPHCHYEFEVIKNGVVIEKIPFQKPYLVVGRLSNCDIILEHPSISRFHCVIQYRREGTEKEAKGVYAYDLESTHGTFQNKYRLLPKAFNRLRVGHMLKFGGSSRLFILQGPDEDKEPESDLTVTELKAQAQEKKLELQKIKTHGNGDNSVVNEETSEGIDWGMGEDAVEEEDEESSVSNPFASNEDLFLNDPKKTLRGWYEREGFELPDYQVEETRPGTFKAKLELPVSNSNGKSITCVIEHKGKKKEAVIQCALEACRILDRQGLLRQAVHEGHEKKRKNWSENDYYDSDEDEFLDRTGDIERKREQRRKELEASKGVVEVETYDSLYDEVVSTLEKLETDLKKSEGHKYEENDLKADSDDLDSYMLHLSSELPDKHKRAAWKIEVIKLSKEEWKLRKLVNVARPLGVPEIPERKSLYSESKKNIFMQSSINNKRKVTPVQKIHQAFLEEEEDMRPKLRKVDCSAPDDDDVAPIPYAKPQRVLSKYEQMISNRNGSSNGGTKSEEKNVASSMSCADQSEATGDKIISDANVESIDRTNETQIKENRLEIPEDNKIDEDNSSQNTRILGPMLPENSTDSVEFFLNHLQNFRRRKN
ncbi:Kanadaptin [Armadillidium nasatum]|uniref:Kanadaptin n=1 Tax=Armadillidium nasatum TaxID=96803 RepID=A0A5N5TFW1_9CRUS|nr:Kanadaptin [Armadillidium nasatum]